jgi:hypothetical protein
MSAVLLFFNDTSVLLDGIRRIAYKLNYFGAAFGAVDTCYFIPALNSHERGRLFRIRVTNPSDSFDAYLQPRPRCN